MAALAANPLFQPIREAAAITDDVIVAVSGGKDSVVTLDLCARHFSRISAFFMYFVRDLSFQERWLRWAEAHYRIDILRIPHMDLSRWVRYGAFRPEQPDSPIIAINDIYAHVRQTFGMEWIAAGERISDSIWRRAMIKKSGAIDHQRKRIYPIANFTKAQVMSYIKTRHLRVSEESAELGFSFRDFHPRNLAMIKHKYPDDYRKIEAQFPFVDANIKQLEFYGE